MTSIKVPSRWNARPAAQPWDWRLKRRAWKRWRTELKRSRGNLGLPGAGGKIGEMGEILSDLKISKVFELGTIMEPLQFFGW